MKKNKRALLAIMLVLSMLLAACGSGGGQASGDGEGESIKLGFTLALTGNFAFMGEGVKEGVELFFEENDYKIGDRPVELFFEDDAGDPQKALKNYQQLTLNQEVDFLGGGTIGSISYALTEAAEKDKRVPIINVVGSGNSLSWGDKSDYVWRIGFSSLNYAGTLGVDMAENIGKKAVVIASDYVAGHEQATDFSANFKEHGGEVLDILWAPSGTSDFSSYINQIKQHDADAVFMFIPGADGPRFVQQFKEFGLAKNYALVDGGSVLNAPSTVEAVGDAVVNGYTLSHYHVGLENELNKKFVDDYTKKYDKVPDNYVINGYDTAKVMSESIQKAGSTEVGDIIETLKAGLSFDSPRGPIELDPKTNHPIQNHYILKGAEKDGEIVFELVRTYEKVQMPAEDPGYEKAK
ncbi:ABC transporter substrate-binding protein [Cytobacillus sp. FSL W7-1323]|uniref:ABC transporter substrate-binding protein n=1 Tax=unclassified Cytobacillus TaxID=2675268 RepID=UPI002AFFDA61|nr:ABC transporter substrate-binding protein [Cytobacillus sp. OWB-43]MEA1854386.1 ABC transporter substrate-binding protein [Cytobacillus sp. OWB-43]